MGGAASITSFVWQLSGEGGAWASLRVQLGRALADSLPVTTKTWQAGQLGMAHATVIDKATKTLTDLQLIAALEAYLADLAVRPWVRSCVNPTRTATRSNKASDAAAPTPSSTSPANPSATGRHRSAKPTTANNICTAARPPT